MPPKEKPLKDMPLKYYLDDQSKRVYTLAKLAPDGKPTHSAQPPRFSIDDKNSRERLLIKERFNLLPPNPKK